ncbi:MAG: hypothetical protein KAS23_07640 [Anaerohalosphaera sp.]|nr:hypothetical protein [Anaerohalosphaera sp.]
MQYLIIIAVVVVLSCFYTGCKRTGSGSSMSGSGQKQSTVEILPEMYKPVTPQQLAERLDKLAALPAPSIKNISAMCYSPAPLPTKSEYVCPICGEKTLYAVDITAAQQSSSQQGTISFLEWELNQCRTLAKEIKAVSLVLDESKFCQNCTGDLEKPSLGIIVTCPDSQEKHSCYFVSADDLLLIKEFELGRLTHKGDFGNKTPIKGHISRLKQLLGVEVDDE